MRKTDHIIALTDEDNALAAQVARRWNAEDNSWGCPVGGGFLAFDESGFKQTAIGVAGEIAFSKFLGIRYTPPKLKAVDVEGFQVRTGSRADYRLIIRERDRDEEIFVLVVRLAKNDYRIVGWTTGANGKRIGKLKNPQVGSRLGPAWFVDQADLTEFTDVP